MRRYFGMFISVRYKPSEDNIALKKLMELFKDRNSINYGMFELDIDPDMTVKQVAEKYRTQLKERTKKISEKTSILMTSKSESWNYFSKGLDRLEV